MGKIRIWKGILISLVFNWISNGDVGFGMKGQRIEGPIGFGYFGDFKEISLGP